MPRPKFIWAYYSSVKNIGRFLYSFGLTIVTFERPGRIESACGLTIVAFERPGCVWTYKIHGLSARDVSPQNFERRLGFIDIF